MANIPKVQKETAKYLTGFKTIGVGIFGIIVILIFAAVGSKVLQSEATPHWFEKNVSSEELANNPEILNGQTVTVRGEIIEGIDDNKFLIGNRSIWAKKEILIVNESGEPVPVVNDNIEIQVTGEVGEFQVAEKETGIGLGDAERYVKYENKPTIFARSIALAPKPANIASNPEQYYGKRVAVEAQIEEVVDRNSFTLDASGLSDRDLLVVQFDSLGSIPREEQTVVVTGIVRQLQVTEVERDYELTWDLEIINKLEAEYENKPVLFADKIYSSTED
ncbi:hypothetical protein [Oscillatoria salina]|uniref:hypothetical protein n=1 Tax=Oscillatoria salina TaxID=331517 RepID=UPI0013BC7F6D|nr:hypothetical protein [Oscillatoria salina]MBZ8179088.1 hypothetical protein [Oscillatoria salina IIICB1]NET90620.1 hypothetical protein [Kamptonema sp. SIO1D9]